MYTYSQGGRPIRTRTSRQPKQLPACFSETGKTTVVTILEPSMRRIVDGATEGAFHKVHVESPPDAVRAVREHAATALLLSPTIAQHHGLAAISGLVAKTPGVTAVAVLGDDWPASQVALLGLGACGVRTVVNLAEREGWNRLRNIIAQHGGECGKFITRRILDAMNDASDEARQFVAIVRLAPVTTTVQALARAIGIEPSTLNSRFFRASLPAPKRYLSMTRLLYAAWFLGMPGVSVAATADALRYSSPQSFGRHVRTTLGLTAAEFRRELPMAAALSHYHHRLIEPYRKTLQSFRPLALC